MTALQPACDHLLRLSWQIEMLKICFVWRVVQTTQRRANEQRLAFLHDHWKREDSAWNRNNRATAREPSWGYSDIVHTSPRHTVHYRQRGMNLINNHSS